MNFPYPGYTSQLKGRMPPVGNSAQILYTPGARTSAVTVPDQLNVKERYKQMTLRHTNGFGAGQASRGKPSQGPAAGSTTLLTSMYICSCSYFIGQSVMLPS